MATVHSHNMLCTNLVVRTWLKQSDIVNTRGVLVQLSQSDDDYVETMCVITPDGYFMTM